MSANAGAEPYAADSGEPTSELANRPGDDPDSLQTFHNVVRDGWIGLRQPRLWLRRFLVIVAGEVAIGWIADVVFSWRVGLLTIATTMASLVIGTFVSLSDRVGRERLGIYVVAGPRWRYPWRTAKPRNTGD
jgi:hypothetical protein